jgi:hypothetical protein
VKHKHILLIIIGFLIQLFVVYIIGKSQGLADGRHDGELNGFEAGREYERERLIDKCNLDKYSWCLH